MLASFEFLTLFKVFVSSTVVRLIDESSFRLVNRATEHDLDPISDTLNVEDG